MVPGWDGRLPKRPGCPHCVRSKIQLQERGIDYDELESWLAQRDAA